MGFGAFDKGASNGFGVFGQSGTDRDGDRTGHFRHASDMSLDSRSIPRHPYEVMLSSKQSTSQDRWATFEREALPHVDRLYRLAMWFVRNRTEAEDLVQETMVQALQSFHRFQPGTNCRAWLTTILQHVRSSRQRSRMRSPLVEDPDDRIGQAAPFVPPIPQGLTDEEILAALARIPPHFQEVILLCDVEEFTYKEIAEALSIPLGTVMSRLHRGRAQLRTELDGLAPVRGLKE
jgi:RNA polymerase sigma-70 factor (ECF subfamily)